MVAVDRTLHWWSGSSVCGLARTCSSAGGARQPVSGDSERSCSDVSASQHLAHTCCRMDDSRRCRDRLPPQTCTHCAANCTDCSIGSGNGTVPCHPPCSGASGRRNGHRLHRSDDAGNAVVHPVQCHCGSDGYSQRPEGSGNALSLHDVATLADGNSAGHLSVSDHWNGDGLRWSVERKHYRGVLPPEEPDTPDGWSGSHDQRGDRQWPVPDPSAGDDGDGNDGGYNQPAFMASAL